MNFFNTRISSSEMFRARLRRCDEVSFIGRAWSDVPIASVEDTAGNTISSQDYVNYTYGHFTQHSDYCGHLHFDRKAGGNFQPWLIAGRWSGGDAKGQFRHTGMIVQGSALDQLGSDDRALVDVRDTATVNEKGGAVFASFRPFVTLYDLSVGATSYSWRVDTNKVELRYGSYTPGEALPAVAYSFDQNKHEFSQPVRLSSGYTVAQLQASSMTSLGFGSIAYCTNGNAGNACLAVLAGGAWYRIPLTNSISAT